MRPTEPRPFPSRPEIRDAQRMTTWPVTRREDEDDSSVSATGGAGNRAVQNWRGAAQKPSDRYVPTPHGNNVAAVAYNLVHCTHSLLSNHFKCSWNKKVLRSGAAYPIVLPKETWHANLARCSPGQKITRRGKDKRTVCQNWLRGVVKPQKTLRVIINRQFRMTIGTPDNLIPYKELPKEI